jgi:hypothetical protein
MTPLSPAAPDFRALCAELLEWAERTSAHYVVHPDVILRARTALAQPEPAPVLTRPECFGFAMSFLGDPEETEVRRYVEALEARAAIQPVPVSERLPGPEDCDAGGRCWWFVPEDDERPSGWDLDGQPRAREIRFYGNTHWLPHHALPTPTP